jgi:hypothetical protein
LFYGNLLDEKGRDPEGPGVPQERKAHQLMDFEKVGFAPSPWQEAFCESVIDRHVNKQEFIKAYKREYRTILAVLQKVGIDYINSGHLKGNPLEHLEYVLGSVRDSCEKTICAVCDRQKEEEKKDKKKRLKVVK